MVERTSVWYISNEAPVITIPCQKLMDSMLTISTSLAHAASKAMVGEGRDSVESPPDIHFIGLAGWFSHEYTQIHNFVFLFTKSAIQEISCYTVYHHSDIAVISIIWQQCFCFHHCDDSIFRSLRQPWGTVTQTCFAHVMFLLTGVTVGLGWLDVTQMCLAQFFKQNV